MFILTAAIATVSQQSKVKSGSESEILKVQNKKDTCPEFYLLGVRKVL